MSVSSCSGHWLGWNQLQDGRSIDCVHAAGGTEDMDPIDCNGHTYIGRRRFPPAPAVMSNSPHVVAVTLLLLLWNYRMSSVKTFLKAFFENVPPSSVPAEVTLAKRCLYLCTVWLLWRHWHLLGGEIARRESDVKRRWHTDRAQVLCKANPPGVTRWQLESLTRYVVNREMARTDALTYRDLLFLLVSCQFLLSSFSPSLSP